jgi:hypothetical protein
MSSVLLCRVVWQKFTAASEVLAASTIALMMEAASTSETSINFYYTTRRNNPEDSNLHVHYYFSLHSTLKDLKKTAR